MKGRTILQFQVEGAAAPPFDLERLRRALPAAYAASQDPVLVPAAGYDAAYETESTAPYPTDQAGTVTFTPLGRAYQLTLPVQGKIVGELFDPEYGRRTTVLGVVAPLSATGSRTGVPYSAIDPATEYVAGAVQASPPELGDDPRPPDPGELGWKDTVRIDPLESCLVALRPLLPKLPFKLDAGERLLDVTRPPDADGGFTPLDPLNALPRTVVNAPADLSWEAYWSIHLPAGLESHTVRPLVLQGSPQAPGRLTATADKDTAAATGDAGASAVTVRWSESIFPPPASSFEVQRAGDEGFREGLTSFTAKAGAASLTDDTAQAGSTYFYRVRAEGTTGYSPWSAPAEVDLP